MSGITLPEERLSFAELGVPERLVKALSRHGIDSPFPIQAATLPDAIGRRDVLGRGQTGSGKTLAFGLAVLTLLEGQQAKSKQPLAVVMVPTRELALQVNDALEPLAHSLKLRTKVVVGGLSIGKQIDALRRGVELVIATPGRLTDLVDRRACDLSTVRVVVLDEADHMADMGFMPAVTALLDHMPATSQKLLFSATLDRDVNTLVKRYLVNPVTHSTAPTTASINTMDHHVMLVAPNDKHDVTASIANRQGRTLMFVRTKHGADRLAKQLGQSGVQAGALHGGKTQNARNRTLQAFRDGRIRALVATDVAARGIHIDGIDLVVHVDPAADHKDYLHRAGRTARAGESGTVVTLVLPPQRKDFERLASKAGISAKTAKVSPGHDVLVKVTGARTPSGKPVRELIVDKPQTAKPSGSRSRGQRPNTAKGRPPRSAAPRTAEPRTSGRSKHNGPHSGPARKPVRRRSKSGS